MNKQMKYIILAFILSGLSGFGLSLYHHDLKYSILPQREVKLIETFHYPARLVKQLQGDPNAGEKIFKEFCSACHSQFPQIDIVAPRIGDREAWQLREKIGINNLLKITISGAGAMPARGGCFECSDEQLVEAIKYILRESK